MFKRDVVNSFNSLGSRGGFNTMLQYVFGNKFGRGLSHCLFIPRSCLRNPKVKPRHAKKLYDSAGMPYFSGTQASGASCITASMAEAGERVPQAHALLNAAPRTLAGAETGTRELKVLGGAIAACVPGCKHHQC